MKTMNYLIIIALMFFGASCTQSESTEVELSATKAQHSSDEEYDFLNGFEMIERSADVQLFKLDVLIAELTEALESGEEGLEEELENAQRDREILSEYRELLDTFRRPRGGRGPGPRPPKGCFVANCNDGINIRGVHGVSIPEEITFSSIEIKNEEGRVIGQGTELTENEFGDLMMLFETNEFGGIATMHITTNIDESNLGKVTVKIPVSFE